MLQRRGEQDGAKTGDTHHLTPTDGETRAYLHATLVLIHMDGSVTYARGDG